MKWNLPRCSAALVLVVLSVESMHAQEPGAAARLDSYGDPLPPRALFRLGTTRLRHREFLQALAISPDGKLLASQSVEDSDFCLWEMPSGRLRGKLTAGLHGGGTMAFSPDSRWLARLATARGRASGSILVWAMDASMKRLELERAPLNSAQGFVFSADSQTLATVRSDHLVQLFSLPSGDEKKQIQLPMPAKGDAVLTIGFVGANQPATVVKLGTTLAVWDVVGRKEMFNIPWAGGGHAALSPDGKWLAISNADRTVSLRNARTGAQQQQWSRRTERSPPLAFSPDGRLLVSGEQYGGFEIWDIATGKPLEFLDKLTYLPSFGVVSADGKMLATGRVNGPRRVYLWDLQTGKELNRFRGHDGPVTSVAMASDGNSIATASWFGGDPVVRLWDPRTGRLIREIEAHRGGVHALAFSPDGKRLATGAWYSDPAIKLWDPATGVEQSSFPYKSGSIANVLFTPDGKRLITGEANAMTSPTVGLRAYDLDTKAVLWEHTESQQTIWALALSPDGRVVVRGGSGKSGAKIPDGFKAWSASSGASLGWKPTMRRTVWRAAFSPDSRLLATTGDETRVWEWISQRVVMEVPNAQPAAFSPDGRFVALGIVGGKLALYDVATGKQHLTLDADETTALAFSPDGRRLISGHRDTTALIWDVADLRTVPAPPLATKLDAAALENCWSALLSADAAAAQQTIWKLAAAEPTALTFLKSKLIAASNAPPPEYTALIRDLDSDVFAVRENAQKQLLLLGHLAEKHLQDALEKKPALETKRRIEQLLDKLDERTPNERWRQTRALAAVERMSGADSLELLKALARGPATAELTQDARAALERRRRN